MKQSNKNNLKFLDLDCFRFTSGTEMKKFARAKTKLEFVCVIQKENVILNIRSTQN